MSGLDLDAMNRRISLAESLGDNGDPWPVHYVQDVRALRAENRRLMKKLREVRDSVQSWIESDGLDADDSLKEIRAIVAKLDANTRSETEKSK